MVTFTARGEQALDELASRLVADCDGTTESIFSLLEQVLATEVGDLAAALDVAAGPAGRARERCELLDGIDADEATLGQSPDDAARRRLSAHAPDHGPGASTAPRQAPGPDR